jgi:proline iminopeptidase
MTPDAYTNKELFIEVGDGHELYVQDWGKKDAKIPFIYLHGGPGDRSKDKYKTQFDPLRQRVIFFDQRSSGRSLPLGQLQHNKTDDLIDDINTITSKLKIKKFILRGGSWGSCLALAYALENPKRVHAMVLDGVFTGSKREIDWLYQGGFKAFFPDAWAAYLGATPKSHHHNPTAYHYKRLLDGTEAQQKSSGYAYANLGGAIINLDDRFTPQNIEDFDPTSLRVEAYYLANNCFMPDRHILKQAHKLKMPVYLIQGRYDAVCPPQTAYELHQALPNSELIWTVSGHRSEREGWNIARSLMLELTR